MERKLTPVEARCAGAQARAEAYAELTTKQKLAKLDAQLGFGQGAAKQRKRLEALLKAEETAKRSETKQQAAAATSKPKKAG